MLTKWPWYRALIVSAQPLEAAGNEGQPHGQSTVSTWLSPNKTLNTLGGVSFLGWQYHTSLWREAGPSTQHHWERITRSSMPCLLDPTLCQSYLCWFYLHPFTIINPSNEYKSISLRSVCPSSELLNLRTVLGTSELAVSVRNEGGLRDFWNCKWKGVKRGGEDL